MVRIKTRAILVLFFATCVIWQDDKDQERLRHQFSLSTPINHAINTGPKSKYKEA